MYFEFDILILDHFISYRWCVSNNFLLLRERNLC